MDRGEALGRVWMGQEGGNGLHRQGSARKGAADKDRRLRKGPMRDGLRRHGR